MKEIDVSSIGRLKLETVFTHLQLRMYYFYNLKSIFFFEECKKCQTNILFNVNMVVYI